MTAIQHGQEMIRTNISSAVEVPELWFDQNISKHALQWLWRAWLKSFPWVWFQNLYKPILYWSFLWCPYLNASLFSLGRGLSKVLKHPTDHHQPLSPAMPRRSHRKCKRFWPSGHSVESQPSTTIFCKLFSSVEVHRCATSFSSNGRHWVWYTDDRSGDVIITKQIEDVSCSRHLLDSSLYCRSIKESRCTWNSPGSLMI